jgi:hypothetical protein
MRFEDIETHLHLIHEDRTIISAINVLRRLAVNTGTCLFIWKGPEGYTLKKTEVIVCYHNSTILHRVQNTLGSITTGWSMAEHKKLYPGSYRRMIKEYAPKIHNAVRNLS